MGARRGIAGSLLAAAYAGVGGVAAAGATAAAALAHGDQRARWLERCGVWEGPARGRGRWVWIHGASYGEAAISLALARELRRRLPGLRVVASATSEAGLRRLRDDHSVESHCFPVDFGPFLDRILAPSAPALVILVETEIWPATLDSLAARGVPVVVVNARLSGRSLPRYRLLRPLVEPALAALSVVLARDEEAAARWARLGAPRASIEVTGNIKFDLAVAGKGAESVALFVRASGDAPVLLGASTHAGEDEVVLDAFSRVAALRPDARLVLAPRHPGRGHDVARRARAAGLRTVEWSVGGASSLETGAAARDGLPVAWPASTDAVLIDRLGLLSRAYAAADAAFVGGSLVDGPGGHNLLEPVMEGCPPAAGPRLGNVADQAALLSAEGLPRLVGDAVQLSKFWLEVLDQPAKFAQRCDALRARVLASSGALGRTVDRLAAILGEDASDGGAARGR